MGFEALETFAPGKEPPTAKVTYLRPMERKTGKPKRDAKPQLKITMPTTLCGVAKSKAFVILIGSGKDAGRLMVQGVKPETPNAIEPKELKHALTFNFGYVPRLGDEIFDERCPLKRITDEQYEIDVNPSWFEAPAAA